MEIQNFVVELLGPLRLHLHQDGPKEDSVREGALLLCRLVWQVSHDGRISGDSRQDVSRSELFVLEQTMSELSNSVCFDALLLVGQKLLKEPQGAVLMHWQEDLYCIGRVRGGLEDLRLSVR